MIRLDTYLHFNGNTEEVFNFYKRVFKSEFTNIMRYGQLPGGDKMMKEEQGKIMHMALPVGQSTLMGTDALDSLNQRLITGDNFSVSITLDNEAEAIRIFDALSDEGEITLPMNRESWATLFGMCKDKYGIQWIVNYNEPVK